MTNHPRHSGTGFEELDWRLETYAAARLEPTPDAARRMRRHVVARAADLAAIQQFEAERLAEEERLRRTPRGAFAWLRTSVARRSAAAFLAASLVVGAAAGVLAAPGGALYPTRIWLETALLPAGGDARAAAHVDLLEQRVEDAEHAAGAADPGGVEAALSAYTAELQQAIRDAQGDPARLGQLQQALGAHLLLLEQLERAAPAGAQNAVHEAINDGRAASREIEKSGKPAAEPTPTPQPPSEGSGADGSGGDGQDNNQSGSDR